MVETTICNAPKPGAGSTGVVLAGGCGEGSGQLGKLAADSRLNATNCSDDRWTAAFEGSSFGFTARILACVCEGVGFFWAFREAILISTPRGLVSRKVK